MHDPITPEIRAMEPRGGPVPQVMRYFACGHLPPLQREVSTACAHVAVVLAARLPHHADQLEALDWLLTAKDCFVRASLDMPPNVALRDVPDNDTIVPALLGLLDEIERRGDETPWDVYPRLAQLTLHKLPGAHVIGTQLAVGLARLLCSIKAAAGCPDDRLERTVDFSDRREDYEAALLRALTAYPTPAVKTQPPQSDAKRHLEEHVKAVQALLSQLVEPLVAQHIAGVGIRALDTAGDILNRFAYHRPKTENTALRHDAVRMVLGEVAEHLRMLVPEGRERSLFLTKLEEAMFAANAGIARNQPEA